ncbi:MAG: AMP-binding protein [Bacteriovoracaceae bacterium]
MKWSEILRKFPTKIISLPDGELSYLELATKINETKCSSPHSFDEKWNRENIIQLFATLDKGIAVVPRSGHAFTPGPGKIYLATSGTEGPARIISHPQDKLFQLRTLYQGKRAGAVLRAGHAAGLEFLFSGILGGNDLYLREDVNALAALQLDILHGPPTALAYMLSFPQRFHTFLERLEVFYNGTDSLPPAVAEKVRSSSFRFSIQQVYGTTETWALPTETHPEKPWLLRFTDNGIKVPDGDRFIEEEKGWGRIESDRHWVANMSGSKINLFDLENSLLGIDGVVDAFAETERGPLSSRIKLVLFTSRIDQREFTELLKPILGMIPYSLELRDTSDIAMKKKNRQR